MITVETWQRIRSLAAQGRSARAIAELMGVSRNTVRAALATDNWEAYSRAPGGGQDLEPYRAMVEAGLRRGLRGCRLLQEVRKAGYEASQATFYRWLRGVRELAKPRPAACRFETDPGEQAQFDWSPYTVVLGGKPTPVFVYSLLLGYSRRVHWFASLSEKMDSVFEGLVEGFVHFYGCCRYLVVDNPKVFVLRHRGADLVFNDAFLRLCGHFRVQPIAGTPRHPQGKGKVENPFSHLETWVVTGNEWRDFDHFREDVATFENAWEERLHGTTKVRPVDRFREESPLLLPLPANPWSVLAVTARTVSNDCLLSFDGVRYSVPFECAPGQVRVRVSQGRALVVCNAAGQEVARHSLQPKGSPPVLNPAHYEGLRRRQRASLATLITRFRDRYCAGSETAECFLRQLLAHHRHHPERTLAGVLELLSGVPDAIALSVLADAAQFQVCRPDYLAELLRRRLGAGQAEAPAAPPPTQLALPQLAVERPLSLYGRALQPEDDTL